MLARKINTSVSLKEAGPVVKQPFILIRPDTQLDREKHRRANRTTAIFFFFVLFFPPSPQRPSNSGVNYPSVHALVSLSSWPEIIACPLASILTSSCLAKESPPCLANWETIAGIWTPLPIPRVCVLFRSDTTPTAVTPSGHRLGHSGPDVSQRKDSHVGQLASHFCPSAGTRCISRPLDERAGPSLFACWVFITHSHVLGERGHFLSHAARYA